MKKNKTLKWLVVFVAVLLASMFFSRTVQTITTPKIQRISATRGKLEEKIPVSAELSFSQGEEVFVKNAKKLNLLFTEVLARQGYFVKKGDLLAKAEIPTLADEMKKARQEHETAVKALGEHLVSQVRLAQDSEHYQVYASYFKALETYHTKRLTVEERATAIGYELPGDVLTWGRETEPAATPRPGMRATPTPPPLADMPQEMKALMQEAFEAYMASEAVFMDLRRIYTGNSKITRTPDLVFDYIKKINELQAALTDKNQELITLIHLSEGLNEVVAPHDGYLIKFELSRGDSYDGSKPLFVISKEGEVPVLKADITEVKKTIEKGTRVEIDSLRQDLAVSEIKTEALNKKFALVELTENIISQLGGISALMGNPTNLTLVYKSARTTTLLPASAVRTDSDGSSYVFTVEQNWGGILGNSQYVLKKQPVTVLEKSNRYVSVAEEVSYYQIADKEDRAVRDGQVVMEYVD